MGLWTHHCSVLGIRTLFLSRPPCLDVQDKNERRYSPSCRKELTPKVQNAVLLVLALYSTLDIRVMHNPSHSVTQPRDELLCLLSLCCHPDGFRLTDPEMGGKSLI